MFTNNLKVCVGVVATDFIKPHTVQTLLPIAKSSPYVASFSIRSGALVHINRENTVVETLKKDYTHLFFVDSDMSFTPEVLDRLLFLDKDIIAAPYNLRRLPPQPMIKLMGDDGKLRNGNLDELPKEPFKCYAMGTGCMLIKMEVFRKIPRPWFFYEPQSDDYEGMGEDVYFCKKAHEAGIDVWCDPLSSEVKHIGNYLY